MSRWRSTCESSSTLPYKQLLSSLPSIESSFSWICDSSFHWCHKTRNLVLAFALLRNACNIWLWICSKTLWCHWILPTDQQNWHPSCTPSFTLSKICWCKFVILWNPSEILDISVFLGKSWLWYFHVLRRHRIQVSIRWTQKHVMFLDRKWILPKF